MQKRMFLFIGMALACAPSGIFSAAPDKVHPAYDIVNLRDPEWIPQSITGLAWLGPDTLAVAEFGGVAVGEKAPTRNGAIHLLTGVLKAKGPGDVRHITIAKDLPQPMGIFVKDGAIYLHEKGDLGTEIHRLVRVGGEWKDELFAKGWGAEEGYMWHSWPGGLVYQDGYWNFNVTSFLADSYKGVVANGKRWPPTERGAWIRLDPVTGKYQVMATGMRTNEATWTGPWGGLFTNDSQGDWLPDNKIIELHPGRFYGHTYGPVGTRTESPPMAYMPEGDASNSPGEGLYMKKSPFKGQMFVTEQTYGGINRYSIERINGELQACVFDFGGTPLAAPYSGGHSQRMVAGPDGVTLFYGCAGGWWVAGPELGSLAKLEPNGKTGFEMLAIRSTGPTGFDIEFTLPVDPAQAGQAANYAVETYTRQPAEPYGAGSRVGRRTLIVKSARLSDAAGKIVHLEFDSGALSTGTVRFESGSLVGIGYTVTFDLKALRSSTGETLFDTKAFYTLNQFGPGLRPIPGCMAAGDPNFDPAANDPYADLCSGTVGLKTMRAATSNPGGIRMIGRTLDIRFASLGAHSLEIFDPSGRLYRDYPRIEGPSFSLELGKPGLYMVRLDGPAGRVTQKVPVP